MGLGIYPFKLTPIRRELDDPILVKGKLVAAYDALEIAEYVDTATGEIISSVEAKRRPDFKPTIRTSELTLQKEAALSRLRPEVREFAYFVLAFRNQRRGMTPPMDGLVKWYALMTQKRPSDVRRYIPRLEEARICHGDVMYPIFQFSGAKVRRIIHLAEMINASGKFTVMSYR